MVGKKEMDSDLPAPGFKKVTPQRQLNRQTTISVNYWLKCLALHFLTPET